MRRTATRRYLPRSRSRRAETRTISGVRCYDSARRALVVVTAITMLSVSACGDDDDATDDTAVEASVAVDVPDVVGESVDDATATLEDAGLTLRVVRRDGEDLPATADFVENRVNVAVETQDDGTEVVTEVVSTG